MDSISARRKHSSSSPARCHVSTHRRRSELPGLAGCGIRFHDNKGIDEDCFTSIGSVTPAGVPSRERRLHRDPVKERFENHDEANAMPSALYPGDTLSVPAEAFHILRILR